MGKKYFGTKENTLESSILSVWQEAAKKEELSTKQKKLDVDGDGEIEGSDLAKLRKKGAKKEGNAFGMALKAAKDKGEKTFVVAGKTYEVKEEVELDEAKYTRKLMKDKSVVDYVKSQQARNRKKEQGYETGGDWTELAAKTVGMEKMSLSKRKAFDWESEYEAVAKKLGEEADLDEGLGVAEDIPAMEIGTDRYRDHTLDVTPGQDDPEWVAARDFKVASMKEALAKVWGLDEKALDKSSKEEYDEEDEELKPVKGSKTMTGGKVAKVEIQPKIDG